MPNIAEVTRLIPDLETGWKHGNGIIATCANQRLRQPIAGDNPVITAHYFRTRRPRFLQERLKIADFS